MIQFRWGCIFELTNQSISYLFKVNEFGLLEHLYLGSHLQLQSQDDIANRRIERHCVLDFEGNKNVNLNAIPQEFASYGTSDYKTPSLDAINSDGNNIHQLCYHSHQIVKDKPSLTPLPSAKGKHSETLLVELIDRVSQLQVTLSYTIYANHDIIAKSVQIKNIGATTIALKQVMSGILDLPNANYDLMHFYGSWGREFNRERIAVPKGKFTIDSNLGTSGNQHNPFLMVMEQGASETNGSVYATTLLYSGNFVIQTEIAEFGTVRVSAGINPFNFNWNLEPNKTWTSPELLIGYSGSGLRQMSLSWHDFIRKQIVPEPFINKPRPTYLNTWEAQYFDVNHQSVMQLAKLAKSLGLEMLVVDDGWFQGRNSDSSALGDWFADSDKFPNGIEATAKEVKQLGLQFGLWLEPEMVNADSELYRKHPEWVIQVPNRKATSGRNQLILDLSQQTVVDYVFDRLNSILSCGNIDYIKWDMNRNMSNQGSTYLPVSQQLELSHRYILGLYRLLQKLTDKYPQVLFENCASGGNRFDLGMLCFMAQGWVSDMSEAIGRLTIINGMSYLYPIDVFAAYIPPIPSHQNGRTSSLNINANVSFFAAARGLSLSFDDIDQNLKQLQSVIKRYRQTAQHMMMGSFIRLFESANEYIWQYNCEQNNDIFLGYFYILSKPNQGLKRVRLALIDIAKNYCVSTLAQSSFKPKIINGSVLSHYGLDLPLMNAYQNDPNTHYMPKGDFSSCIFHIQKQP